jgi:hypothetical protein
MEEQFLGTSDLHPPRVIEVQGDKRCAPGCAEGRDTVVLPPEVVIPPMAARVEERNELAGKRVRNFDPICFMQIAPGTGQGKVHQS